MLRPVAIAILWAGLLAAGCAHGPGQGPPTNLAVPPAAAGAGTADTPGPPPSDRGALAALRPASNAFRAFAAFLTGLDLSIRIEGGCC